MDINMKALRYVSDSMPNNVVSEFSSEYNIRKHLPDTDLIIGGVLIKGAKAPKLITRDMLKEMRLGSVIVDVAVDQGGCFETTKPTTHQDPTYIIDGVVHYTVANMPGAVPYTSTMGLTNVTLPYVIKLANEGWENACAHSAPLAKGLNIVKGEIVYKEIAEAFDMKLQA
jgi:alanine dehydrogenase